MTLFGLLGKDSTPLIMTTHEYNPVSAVVATLTSLLEVPSDTIKESFKILKVCSPILEEAHVIVRGAPLVMGEYEGLTDNRGVFG